MTDLALAGLSKTRMFYGIKGAFDKKACRCLNPVRCATWMSKQQYFGRKSGNADPHLMFWFPNINYSPEPITEFNISVSKW